MTYSLIQRLNDIKSAIERALAFVEGKEEKDFFNDDMLQSAVERKIEIIGEAAGKIIKKYKKFTEDHPNFPWEDLSSFRNIVSHEYFRDENLYEIWESTVELLPGLLIQIDSLIKSAYLLETKGEITQPDFDADDD